MVASRLNGRAIAAQYLIGINAPQTRDHHEKIARFLDLHAGK
jgi:hypothetical protein